MASSANKLMKEMQKIASDAQVKVQELANSATEKSFEYNAKEANTARAWQKEMSDTAHQREVKDLVKAGLNPVLATNQGAQSYTTSSASAQANDPSSSIGSLAGQLIQSRTGAYQADTSAKATKAAAASQAAATRYAAAANLAAAREAASAQRYAADKAYQSKIETSVVGRAGNTIRDIAKKTGLTDYLSAQFGKDISFAKNLTRNDTEYLRNPDARNKWTLSNITLRGQAQIARQVRSAGFDFASRYNMQLYLDAFLNNDKTAQRQWAALIRKSPKFHTQR